MLGIGDLILRLFSPSIIGILLIFNVKVFVKTGKHNLLTFLSSWLYTFEANKISYTLFEFTHDL